MHFDIEAQLTWIVGMHFFITNILIIITNILIIFYSIGSGAS